MNCAWNLICTTGDPTLSFSSFATEGNFDFVRVDTDGDGNTDIDLHGSTIPADVTGVGSMAVVFTTDGTVTSDGFDATFTCASASAVNDPCDGTPVDIVDGGSLASHDDAGDYADGMNCAWNLICTTGDPTLSFSSFATEGNYDFVRVDTDGDGNTDIDLHGSTIPADVTGVDSMAVVFTTDGSVTSDGFDATFTCASASASAVELTGQATYAIEIEAIPLGSAARATFEDEFTAAIADALAVQTEDVVINSITSVRMRTHPSGSSFCTGSVTTHLPSTQLTNLTCMGSHRGLWLSTSACGLILRL
jgi:hypothetical protein